MALKYLFYGAAGIAASAVFVANLSPMFIPKPQLASLQHFAKAKLQTIDKEQRNFSEAEGLASLLPEMEAHGVRLHAVVHETLGANEFKPFLKGDVYLDVERNFFGPEERWAPTLTGLHMVPLIRFIKAQTKKPGNYEGEGRLLGGSNSLDQRSGPTIVGPDLQSKLFARPLCLINGWINPPLAWKEKAFFGPQQRWASLSAVLSYSAIKNIYQAKGTSGNMKGEGRLLGAVFVIGPGDQGILYQHHEEIYGDHANLDEVRAAVQKVKQLN